MIEAAEELDRLTRVNRGLRLGRDSWVDEAARLERINRNVQESNRVLRLDRDDRTADRDLQIAEAARLWETISRLEKRLAHADEAMRGYKAMCELQASGAQPSEDSES